MCTVRFLRREDLKEEKFIYPLTPSGTICDDSYIRLYQEAGYEPNIVYYTDDIDSILMMVAAEEGISVMPTYITRKLYHTEGIVCVPLRGEQECASNPRRVEGRPRQSTPAGIYGISAPMSAEE